MLVAHLDFIEKGDVRPMFRDYYTNDGLKPYYGQHQNDKMCGKGLTEIMGNTIVVQTLTDEW